MSSNEADQQRLLGRYGRRFSAGDVLFEAGQTADEAFLLQEGRVRLIKQIGSSERMLRVVRPGEVFGETALVAGATRGSTAVALDDGSVLALAHERFEQLLAANPPVGMRVIQQLVRRLRDAEDQIELLMLRDSQAKVVVALLQLSHEAGAANESGGASLSVSPLELSARVGLDVETVKRNVSQLRQSGYIQITDERIEVPDVDALGELRGLLDVKDEIVGAGGPAPARGT